MEWADGKLQAALVHSRLGGPVTVRYGAKLVTLQTEAGQEYRLATPALVSTASKGNSGRCVKTS